MLVVGMVAAVGITAATPASAATTESFTLTSASQPGQSTLSWQGTSNTLTDPISLSGQIDPTSGALSATTLSFPSWSNVQQGETVVYTLGEVSPGTATGTYDGTTGATTLNDSLSLTVAVAGNTCVSSPLNVALSGTYDATTQDVTLATTSSFTIPQFPDAASTGTCSGTIGNIIAAGLNANPGGIAGSTGNALSIALNGQFKAGLPTTTALSVLPASPQLAGTTLTLSATVTDPSGAGTPGGTVNFLDNGVSIGSGTLDGTGAASMTTSTLPGGTQSFTARYSGDSNYAVSTSSSQPYSVQSIPSISNTLPSSIPAGTPVQFTTTATNPSSGADWTNLQLGFLPTTAVPASVAYLDPSGAWCPIARVSSYFNFTGYGTSACGTPPVGGFALAHGTSITITYQIEYTAGTTPGNQSLAFYLYTVNSSGAKVAPFSTSAKAPNVKTYVQVTPPSFFTPIVTVAIPYPTVVQGFTFTPTVGVTAPSTPSGLPTPTGSIVVSIDGTVMGTSPPSVNGQFSLPVSTAGISVGTHTLTVLYEGDGTYAQASASTTLTIAAVPPGTPYICTKNVVGGTTTSTAYVTAHAAPLPYTVASGTKVPVSELNFTMTYSTQGVSAGTNSFAYGISPNGTLTAPTPTFTSANGVGIMTVTGAATTTPVTVTGATGDIVTVGLGSIQYGYGSGIFAGTEDCEPATQPASIGSITIPGVTLAVSPSAQVAPGTPVSLTADVVPTANQYGLNIANTQVTFFDGSAELGTGPAATGVATANLAPGVHQLSAQWGGGAGIPPQTSNTVSLLVTSPYWTVSSDGTVSSGSGAPNFGSMGGQPLNQPIVGMAATPDGGGYWEVASDGGIFSFGDATFYGSMGGQPLNAPVVGMAATPDGGGYWEVASDGGIFSFGDATFYGSMGGQPLNEPVVGMAAAPSGGYWLVASDGGIFSFGADFHGSTGGMTLNAPVVGMAASPDGSGYWLVAQDGGVFSFDVPFFGSMGGSPTVGMAATPDGQGYWTTTSDGSVTSFGSAGSGTATTGTSGTVGIAGVPDTAPLPQIAFPFGQL